MLLQAVRGCDGAHVREAVAWLALKQRGNTHKTHIEGSLLSFPNPDLDSIWPTSLASEVLGSPCWSLAVTWADRKCWP